MGTRSYNNTLRQKQAEATRELILRSLAEQLATGGLQDFSVVEAAQRAGVATRTVYRYFPNREAVLDAIGRWVDQQFGDLPFPTNPQEVVDLAEQVFPRFEQEATLVQALLVSELGQNVRSRVRSKRRQSIETALSGVADDSDSARAIKAVIGHLMSAETWQQLHDEFELDGEAAGQAVAWAVRTLIHEMEGQV